MSKQLGILEWFVASLLMMLVALVFAQVVVRYLTYHPLAWTEEAARYIFIWLCLFGAAVAARRGQHFAVDLALRSLPTKTLRFVSTAIQLVEAAFYGIVTLAGLKLLRVVHLQTSPSLDISMSIPYLAIPLGAALMAVIAVRRAWTVWSRHSS